MKRFPRTLTLPLAAMILVAADAPPKQAKPDGPAPAASVARSAPGVSVSRRRHTKPERIPGTVADMRAANRAATLIPAASGFVNAVQVYPYADGLVFQVYAAPGAITDIALQPGEALVSVASGDTVRWVIGDTTSGAGTSKRTHVLVKPFAAGLVTNLIITTDRRSYHLALASTARTALSGVAWTYPQDELIALKRDAAAAEVVAPVAAGLAVDQLRFDYRITGDKPAWRPLRAFDDGRQTFIQFPATLAVGEAPPLFLVDRQGDAQLVNYRLRGRFYIVDRLFDAAELRLGTKHQAVVRISRDAKTDRKRS